MDDLNLTLKLGASQVREDALGKLEILITKILINDFGGISASIPEVQNHLYLRSVQPKPLSMFGRFIQLLDTSFVARSLVIIVVVFLINVLNPSLWEYLQNISSLFQITLP